MAAILNSVILNLAILDSAILVLPLILTHTCQDQFPTFAQKNFTHSFWLNLMIAAILKSVILNSAILCKNNFTCSFWLNWMMAAILNSAILVSAILHKKTLLVHSDSTWWWQPSWILPCWIQSLPSWIQTPCYLLSDSLKNTLTPFWSWLKLVQSESNSFILTQIDDGSHLEFCHLELGHLGFSHFSSSSHTHSHLPRSVPYICTKKLHSFILTQLDDGSHLEFCHVGFSHFTQKKFTHSFWLNLMMVAILNSAILDSESAILDLDT